MEIEDQLLYDNEEESSSSSSEEEKENIENNKLAKSTEKQKKSKESKSATNKKSKKGESEFDDLFAQWEEEDKKFWTDLKKRKSTDEKKGETQDKKPKSASKSKKPVHLSDAEDDFIKISKKPKDEERESSSEGDTMDTNDTKITSNKELEKEEEPKVYYELAVPANRKRVSKKKDGKEISKKKENNSKKKNNNNKNKKKKGNESEDSSDDNENENNNNKEQETKPNSKRRKKTWDDVARFARINFTDTSKGSNRTTSNRGIGSSVFEAMLSSSSQKQSDKKKGRVQNKMRVSYKVRSLQMMCVDILCEYIDHVEAFGAIGPDMQSLICSTLARKGKLTDKTLGLFLTKDTTSLSLSNSSEIDPYNLRRISDLKSLTSLSLSGAGRLNDSTLKLISDSCSNLIDISLIGCYQLTDESLCPMIESHPNLIKLSLGWTYLFTKKLIEIISTNCKILKYLSISNCSQVNDDIISPIGKLSMIESLHIDCYDNITDCGIIEITNSIQSSLYDFKLSGGKNITSNGLIKSIGNCMKLSKLSLSSMDQIDDDCLLEIIPNKKIEHLALEGCDKITDKSISFISNQNGHRLKTLQIRTLGSVTKLSLADVVTNCPLLNHLDLSWCRDVDDDIIESLIKKCKMLNRLTLWGCNRVTDFAVSFILRKGINVIGKDQSYVSV